MANDIPALITVSTRASLKKYHTFNLVLGQGDNGDEWQFDRIGTEQEKLQVEREVQELRERLAQVEEWKKRREEIEDELAAVWTDKGGALEAPAYTEETESQPELVERPQEQVEEQAEGQAEEEAEEEAEKQVEQQVEEPADEQTEEQSEEQPEEQPEKL
jgi:ATP-binding cassette subfamily D (ALD) long-chain fatty acid import protein